MPSESVFILRKAICRTTEPSTQTTRQVHYKQIQKSFGEGGEHWDRLDHTKWHQINSISEDKVASSLFYDDERFIKSQSFLLQSLHSHFLVFHRAKSRVAHRTGNIATALIVQTIQAKLVGMNDIVKDED